MSRKAKAIQKSASLNQTAQKYADLFICYVGIVRAEVLARRVFEKIVAAKNSLERKDV